MTIYLYLDSFRFSGPNSTPLNLIAFFGSLLVPFDTLCLIVLNSSILKVTNLIIIHVFNRIDCGVISLLLIFYFPLSDTRALNGG